MKPQTKTKMTKKITKKIIPVRTDNGTRYMRVPIDELNGVSCSQSNEIGTGVFCTDVYKSPRGRVIERIASQWVQRDGTCPRDQYRLVEDRDMLIDRYDGYGLVAEKKEAIEA